ncbi:amino acid dehydrogenase [Bacterioplanes sanyensis]|uniref:Amino acid dehydrogenase n=1 Tax=Bacterioplanes sanyensis TaxID=1249553 RepID=A0A222FJP3_9GAMM|nr:Glu/Leu/Phe/Val dehydrogenase [Bacterioplanes sanyensis]ASP38806.1 amino acid dehydrogenase [Bacterioplanes sanyensis]
MSVFSHKDFDHHEDVHFHHDPATGLKAIVAVHNTSRGPALGGCRMFAYQSDEEALSDVLRLSRGMSYKSAMANLPLGGGKSVIIGDPSAMKTPALLQAMGKFVHSLGGQYIAAEDSGTSVPDIEQMGSMTPHVAGIQSKLDVDGNPVSGDPSPSTAYGVFVGIKAAVQHKLQRDLNGVKVAIQGLGNVGMYLAQYLADAGAKLTVCDINEEKLNMAKLRWNANIVSVEDIFAADVDVFAPCAMGGAINDQTLPQIKATVIAGAANNQLAEKHHDQAVLERGILYAPDYVINAGGIIDVSYEGPEYSAKKARTHIDGIGDTLAEIFERSDATGQPTELLANKIAEERLQLRTPEHSL